MRGGDGAAAASLQFQQQRFGQRRPLGGIGAGTDFIEENERLRAGLLHHPHDIRHVTGKNGQVLRDRSLVADIREYLREHGQPAAGISRQIEPLWAINASRPTVFRVTVLPPVLGPATTKDCSATPKARSMGTALAPRSGWRA